MSFTSLFSHIVFSTKERRPFLQADDVSRRTPEYIGGMLREMGGQMLAADGAADHLHVCALLPATVAPADVVRDVKAYSSRWIHQTWDDLRGFAWQEGYAAFSVSKSVVPKVLRYIRGQQAHHRKVTPREEILALLRAHEIEFDEQYVV